MFQILVTIARNFREAREMRDEKGRLEGLHDKYMEEAEKAKVDCYQIMEYSISNLCHRQSTCQN